MNRQQHMREPSSYVGRRHKTPARSSQFCKLAILSQ